MKKSYADNVMKSLSPLKKGVQQPLKFTRSKTKLVARKAYFWAIAQGNFDIARKIKAEDRKS